MVRQGEEALKEAEERERRAVAKNIRARKRADDRLAQTAAARRDARDDEKQSSREYERTISADQRRRMRLRLDLHREATTGGGFDTIGADPSQPNPVPGIVRSMSSNSSQASSASGFSDPGPGTAQTAQINEALLSMTATLGTLQRSVRANKSEDAQFKWPATTICLKHDVFLRTLFTACRAGPPLSLFFARLVFFAFSHASVPLPRGGDEVRSLSLTQRPLHQGVIMRSVRVCVTSS